MTRCAKAQSPAREIPNPKLEIPNPPTPNPSLPPLTANVSLKR